MEIASRIWIALLSAGTPIFFFTEGARAQREYLGHYHDGPGHMILGGLGMLIFWALLIALIILGVRWAIRQENKKSKENATPRRLLEERYARGEIDEEEFDRRNKKLSEEE